MKNINEKPTDFQWFKDAFKNKKLNVECRSELFTRSTLFIDAILTFFMGGIFITWHHGLAMGVISSIIGICLSWIGGITIGWIYWIILGLLHPLVYDYSSARFDTPSQPIETVIMVFITIILIMV